MTYFVKKNSHTDPLFANTGIRLFPIDSEHWHDIVNCSIFTTMLGKALKYPFGSLLKSIFLALLCFFCWRFLTRNWHAFDLSERLANLSIEWIVAAIGFIIVYHFFALMSWILILDCLAAKIGVRMAIKAYVYSLLPKYVPGKIFSHGIRIHLSTMAGVSLAAAVTSVILELLFGIVSGLALSVPGLLFYYPAALNQSALSVSLTAVIALTLISVLGAVTIHKSKKIVALSTKSLLRRYLKIFFIFLFIWLAIAFSYWCIANALSTQPLSLLLPLVAAVAASWILGAISVFTPAGLGIREAALYFFMRPWMSDGDAILLATLSRLVLFVVELFLSLGCWICFRFLYDQETPNVRETIPQEKIKT